MKMGLDSPAIPPSELCGNPIPSGYESSLDECLINH